jgi:hypothetical protein
MNRLSPSLLSTTASSFRWISSAARNKGFRSCVLSFPFRSLESCRTPSMMASSHLRRSPSERVGSIDTEFVGFSSSCTWGGGGIFENIVVMGFGDWDGEGEEGGVDDERWRKRWTSPKNTLPIADIAYFKTGCSHGFHRRSVKISSG